MKLESLYQERGQAIRDSINLLSPKYPKVFSFDCPEELIEFGDEVDGTLLSYHYTNAVYEWFAGEIAEKIKSSVADGVAPMQKLSI